MSDEQTGEAREPESFGVDKVSQFMTDMRSLARQLLLSERADCSIRPTALVCSGLRRLKRSDQDWDELQWTNRKQFFGAMHRVMRQSLVDHARKKTAQRRPPLNFVEPGDLDFYDIPSTLADRPEQIVALEEALEWLRLRDENLANIILYHYFTGLTVPELAEFFEVSEKTVKRRLAEARLLLHRKALEVLNPAS